MASRLNEEKLEKKFLQVSNSQDSIQTLSLWIIYHKSYSKKIVDIWLKTLKKSKIPHRLVLLYVANDVIQTCKRKSAPQFAEAFSEVLAEATLLIRDEKIRPNVERVFNVWNQRSIFTADFIEGLRNILTNSKVQSMQPKFVAEFKPQKVMDKIRKIKKIELESVTKLSAISSSKLDCSSSEIIYQLKDRTHGHQIVHEYDEAVRCLQDYIEIIQKELSERSQLIELLEKGEIFYNAQNGEVKVVANAYRTFSGRVKGLKKKLDELLPSVSSPIPSPCSDAPSPTPSEEGPIMSPIIEAKEEMKQEAVLPTKIMEAEKPEEKKIEAREKPKEKTEKLPLLDDVSSSKPSPKSFLSKTPTLSQSVQLSQQAPTPPVTTKSQQNSDGLEEQASGMMTSWFSAFNANNPTFTKAFSLDSRVPQTGSLESRLSSLMENLPNLPQVFRTSNYEPLIQSAGSTPIRVDQPNVSSPARIPMTTSYVENQSDNGEPGTPVNDENRRDATPVEDEDTRFSGGNNLPLASVMSTLSNEDLHQSLLKSLSHLQQLSASNTPPPVTQSQQSNTSELRSTSASVSSPSSHENYRQNAPALTKADTSFNSLLPNIPSFLRSPFNLSDIQNAPSIFSAASKLSFPSHSLQPPSPNEDPTKILSNLGSPPQIYNYATNSKDEIQSTVPSMQTEQSNYNKQDFSTEEENLEPMDMDLDESDEEEKCSNIIEGIPPGSGDVDLRMPPLPQKTSVMPITWSSCITTDVAALIPPVSYSDIATRPELNIKTNNDSHPLQSLVSQHCPIQDTQYFNETNDHKVFKDEDMRHHNVASVTSHHLEDMGHFNDDMRHHNVDAIRCRVIDDRRHHSVDDEICHSADDGLLHNVDDGRRHSIDDERHHSYDDVRLHSSDDGRQHGINDERELSIDNGRQRSIDDGRQRSIDDGRQHSIDDGRQHSIDDGRQHSIDDGRQHSIDDGRQHSIDDGRQHGVGDGRLQNVDDGRLHSVDEGKIHSVDNNRLHSIEDVSHHSVDSTSHHSIDNANHHSVDDASHHSVNDTSHHSIEDGSHHSLDDVKYNINNMGHHNVKDIRQYNFEDVRQHSIVDLTPHNVKNVRHYNMESTTHLNIDDDRHHVIEDQKYQSNNDTRCRSNEDVINQNIGDVSHTTEGVQHHDIAYSEMLKSSTNEDTKHKNSSYVERFSSGNVENVRHHNMPYVEGLSGSCETETTTSNQTPIISTSESSYYHDNYEHCVFQHSLSTQMKDEGQCDENRIQTIHSTRQNNDWSEKWNEEPWERQNFGPVRRRGQPYFKQRFPDYQNRYPQEPYQPYGRRNNYRPRFQVPPFNPRYPPPTHLIPGGRGNFPPRY